MELKRALISKRGIFRVVGLVKDLQSKRPVKIDGAVYEQTKENGVVRIRMVVKKCDLEKLIDIAKVQKDDVLMPSLVEQRLRQLRRKHHAKLVDKKRSSYWTPALRSIPEEF